MGGCRRFWVLPLLALVLLAGCAPAPAAAPQGGGASGAGQTAAAPAQPQRTLVLASRVEPGAATPRVDQSSGIVSDLSARLFVAGLVYLDDQEVPRPYL